MKTTKAVLSSLLVAACALAPIGTARAEPYSPAACYDLWQKYRAAQSELQKYYPLCPKTIYVSAAECLNRRVQYTQLIEQLGRELNYGQCGPYEHYDPYPTVPGFDPLILSFSLSYDIGTSFYDPFLLDLSWFLADFSAP